MKTLLTKEPIESMLTFHKEGDGNNAKHLITFKSIAYNTPVEFAIRGEWEMQAFKTLRDVSGKSHLFRGGMRANKNSLALFSNTC